MLAQKADILTSVMNLAYAEPDETWGQRPCEGSEPSNLTCVSACGVAAGRTHPGLGAACKGSNAADLLPESYGGQIRPGYRRLSHEQQKRSEPAAASQEAFEVAVPIYRHREPVPYMELVHGRWGVISSPWKVGGGDPFTALEITYD